MLKPETNTYSIIEKEISECLTTYRIQFTLFAQILLGLVVADVTILGFAISSHINYLFDLGAVFPILALMLKIKFNQMAFPVIYTAYHLEQKLGQENIDWLATTYIAALFEKSDKILHEINSKETHKERMKCLHDRCKLRHYRLFSRHGILFTLLVLFASIIQILLPYFIHSGAVK